MPTRIHILCLGSEKVPPIAPPALEKPAEPVQRSLDLIDKESVQHLIEAALDSRFPRAAEVSKTCSQCSKELFRAAYTVGQFASQTPICKTCQPVDERLTKRTLATKTCSGCHQTLPRDNFTDTQWRAGAASKCKSCTARGAVAAKIHTKECRTCHEIKAKELFSVTQWEMPKIKGSSCRRCSDQTAIKRQNEFSEEVSVKRRAVVEEVGASPWQTQDPAEAKRWLLQAPLEALPSSLAETRPLEKCIRPPHKRTRDSLMVQQGLVSGLVGPGGFRQGRFRVRRSFSHLLLKLSMQGFWFPGPNILGVNLQSLQAMHAVGNRPEWWKRGMKLDDSQIPVQQKIMMLQASHQDQMHLDGREGMVRALHDEGKRWLNMDLDAAYVLRHCSHCLATSTRGVAEPAPRHLPRPMAAGDILGVDLKKVVPPDGAPWVMLLLVDFATNRLWAFDMDVDKLLGLE